MVEIQAQTRPQWLSLGQASQFLHVNEATLRHWADNGVLRVYRTPGGHRRFLHEDVLNLTSQSGQTSTLESKDKLADSALRRIRKKLGNEDVTRQSWYQSVEGEGRDRMRLFGRHLLSVLLQESAPRRRRQEALAESLILGREYGSEMTDRGVTLKNTVEALIFFRNIVIETVSTRDKSRVLVLADQVLLGVVESHGKRTVNL
ncbi:MAG: helix-turn-helix domain-containing protein [Chloroflexota bacterium]|nr:helix-turn-helix domain-containing protein [Chloroflexota bacterium]